MSLKPIAERRGCEWDDFGNAISLIAVRASVEDVAKVLNQHYRGTVEKVDPSPVKHGDIANVVFQHVGQAYSVFASTDRETTDLAGKLSKELKTRVICLMHEDTAGWTECRVFDGGENVETYTFGPDYADEMETMAEELGQEDVQMMPNDDGKPWDHRVKDEDENDYLFRSELRKVDADLVSNSDEMVNHAFASAGAWMPGWAHFPFSDPKEYPGEAKSEFVSVLRVKTR